MSNSICATWLDPATKFYNVKIFWDTPCKSEISRTSLTTSNNSVSRSFQRPAVTSNPWEIRYFVPPFLLYGSGLDLFLFLGILVWPAETTFLLLVLLCGLRQSKHWQSTPQLIPDFKQRHFDFLSPGQSQQEGPLLSPFFLSLPHRQRSCNDNGVALELVLRGLQQL